MKDLECPNCREIISFRNMIVFEEKEIKLEGIVYVITCLKCDTFFISPMRQSKKMKNRIWKEMKKKIDEDLK